MCLQAEDRNAVNVLLEGTQTSLAVHLDRSYAAARRAKTRGDAKKSRSWYLPAATWVAGSAAPLDPEYIFGADIEKEQATVQYSVAADDSQTTCALSGEKFEIAWDDTQQHWRYEDARRLDSAEAAMYGLSPGAIVLVSALGQPSHTADTIGEHHSSSSVRHHMPAHHSSSENAAAQPGQSIVPQNDVSAASVAAVKVEADHSSTVPTSSNALPPSTAAVAYNQPSPPGLFAALSPGVKRQPGFADGNDRPLQRTKQEGT